MRKHDFGDLLIIVFTLVFAVIATAKPFRDAKPAEEKPFTLLGEWESGIFHEGDSGTLYKVRISKEDGNTWAEWFTTDGELRYVGCFELNILEGWTETYTDGPDLNRCGPWEWARDGEELKGSYNWYLRRKK